MTTADTATLRATVTPELATTHLPAERAVLMTPSIIGLAELCVAQAEGDGRWESVATSLRHRAGLRTGEQVTLTAVRHEASGDTVRWQIEARGADGTLIGDGALERRRLA
jgi:predicted thioesterase